MPPRAYTRRYSWVRYWTPPGANIEDAFLADVATVRLRHDDVAQLAELVDDPCLILLGEPGLGKSYAIGDAVSQLRALGHAVHLVDLGAYDDGASLIGAIVDSVIWREWREGDYPLFLFLDGLDEALLHIKPIHSRLIAELTNIGGDIARLRLRISCRTGEWITDLDTRLRELYAPAPSPRRLTLAPLRLDDAAEAARAEGLDGDQFVDEIRQRDLQRLAAFPLTLRMMLDIAALGDGQLPSSQAELFDRAILHLAEEPDTGRRRELRGKPFMSGDGSRSPSGSRLRPFSEARQRSSQT